MEYRIKEFRESQMMTQETLAKESGVSCDIIQALESGTKQITTPETLTKLAKALGTTIDQISTQTSFPSKDLLLNSIGYKGLLEMITPEDTQQAKFLLGPFLQGLRGVDIETIAVLSYLFGIKQQIKDLYGTDATGKSFADRASDLYKMGKQHGFHEALLLFGKVPPYSIIQKPKPQSSQDSSKTVSSPDKEVKENEHEKRT